MSKRRRNVLFTFDYELFFGVKSGTVDNCLIAPTNRILGILSKFSIKAVFFVDTTYLIKLEQLKDQHPKVKADWLKIVEQLQTIFLQGHEIFLHLHPLWLDAKYLEQTNTWDLTNFSKYRFNSINATEKDFIWKESIRILSAIIHPLDATYKFDSYRAGGWCIQPFSDFRPYFEKYGVQNDFSIKPGYKLFTEAHHYDFLTGPDKNMYSFGTDILTEDPKGTYTEFVTSGIAKTEGLKKYLDKVFNRILLKAGLKGYGDGVPIGSGKIYIQEVALRSKEKEMISVENLTLPKLPGHLAFLKRNTYMQFLSHPKMVNEYQLFCLTVFLSIATKLYSLNTDFRKITPEND